MLSVLLCLQQSEPSDSSVPDRNTAPMLLCPTVHAAPSSRRPVPGSLCPVAPTCLSKSLICAAPGSPAFCGVAVSLHGSHWLLPSPSQGQSLREPPSGGKGRDREPAIPDSSCPCRHELGGPGSHFSSQTSSCTVLFP